MTAEVAQKLLNGTLAMTVARLGGTVEGAPTQRINFLQRIDELREAERERDALKAKLEAMQDILKGMARAGYVQAFLTDQATLQPAQEEKSEHT